VASVKNLKTYYIETVFGTIIHEKMKLNRKSPLVFILIFLLPFLFFVPFQILGNKQRQKFHKAKINSTIISSSDLGKKVVEYYLPNDLEIDVSLVEDINIKVGDSISKDVESWEYKVYKKNADNTFEFYKTYIMEK
jgi:hypothetical protein